MPIKNLKNCCIEVKRATKRSPILKDTLGIEELEYDKYRFVSANNKKTKWYGSFSNDNFIYDASDIIKHSLTISDLEGLPRKRI